MTSWRMLVALVLIFLALSASGVAGKYSFCAGAGCSPGGQIGKDSAQVGASISQVGGEGNSASIEINNFYGMTPMLPEGTTKTLVTPATPTIDGDSCLQTATQFFETVSNFFVSDFNGARLLTANTMIPSYQSFLTATNGIFIGYLNVEIEADRNHFVEAARKLWDGPILVMETYDYGWEVVIFAVADHGGKTIECRAIDVNPATGYIRIENPEGWVRIQGSSAVANVPLLGNRARVKTILQIS